MYAQPDKVSVIQAFLLKCNDNMEKSMVLDETDKEEQDPTVQVWLYYYIGNHFLFLRDPGQALEFVNKAIEHTPTLLDLYTLKGKIM